MTHNQLEITVRNARYLMYFAHEIREELDEAVACALWGDSEVKNPEDLRERLTGLVNCFVDSFERARQEMKPE